MSDIKDAIDAWSAGKEVETIEMGGISDEYERAIHSAVFGILEAMHESFYKQVSKQMDEIVSTLPDEGWSGAQIGAAKQVAFKALCYGWKGMTATIPRDRLIKIAKRQPS